MAIKFMCHVQKSLYVQSCLSEMGVNIFLKAASASSGYCELHAMAIVWVLAIALEHKLIQRAGPEQETILHLHATAADSIAYAAMMSD